MGIIEGAATALVVAAALVAGCWHMPKAARGMLGKLPAWLVAIVLHFGYGAWVGGVSGHLLGAFLSVPMFLAWHFWLRPKFQSDWKDIWARPKNIFSTAKEKASKLWNGSKTTTDIPEASVA